MNKYTKEKLISEESELIIFGFILFVIKSERMKYEDTNAENLIKSNKEYLQSWAIYSKIIENYKLTDCLYCKLIYFFIYFIFLVLKYNTNDLQYFYILREEIFPSNINNRPISNFNSRNVKGKYIKLIQNYVVSFSQALEWTKYSTSYPLIDDGRLFVPY